jgi:hypothetical protein
VIEAGVIEAGVIKAVGIAVPAHNEETLLPDCLLALRRAASRLGVPVRVLVVADSCTDRTVAVARRFGARVVGIGARNVGAARATGMTALLRLMPGLDPAAVWLATTDADTVVPAGWLRRQLGYADQGWDVVLGTVTVADWSEHPAHVPAAFTARYESGGRPHPHVHGANLGIRASAYLAAGGFRSLRSAEDHALLAAATEAGCSVLQASDIAVQTSARRQARAPDGFSHLLRTLAPLPEPPPASARPGARQTLLFQELRFVPPVYLRVLGWIGRMELADQLVQPGGQDDDEPRRPGPGVAERMRSAGGYQDGGAGFGGDQPAGEPEPERAGHDVPGLVVGVVDVQGRHLAVYSVIGPVPDDQGCSPDGPVAVTGSGRDDHRL